MMAKPTLQQRHTRGRLQILSSARELVLEVGADKVSLRAIAARAGYSPASLYEYFNSKESLLSELANEVLIRLDHRLSKVPTHLPIPKKFVRYGVSYLAFARENPEDYLLVFSKLRSVRTSIQQTPSSDSPYRRLLQTAQAGLEGKLFAPARKAEEIAYGLWALVHGLVMLQLTHLRSYDADFENLDQLALEAYVAGIMHQERI